VKYLFIIVLLVWAVPVGAEALGPKLIEPLYTQGICVTVTQKIEKNWLPRVDGMCHDEDSRLPEFQLPDCLAKMEAAMRGLDWYLPRALQRGNDDRWRSYMQLSDAGHEAVVSGLKQWDEVKRECWSK